MSLYPPIAYLKLPPEIKLIVQEWWMISLLKLRFDQVDLHMRSTGQYLNIDFVLFNRLADMALIDQYAFRAFICRYTVVAEVREYFHFRWAGIHHQMNIMIREALRKL